MDWHSSHSERVCSSSSLYSSCLFLTGSSFSFSRLRSLSLFIDSKFLLMLEVSCATSCLSGHEISWFYSYWLGTK
jgi:hypothetical protein